MDYTHLKRKGNKRNVWGGIRRAHEQSLSETRAIGRIHGRCRGVDGSKMNMHCSLRLLLHLVLRLVVVLRRRYVGKSRSLEFSGSKRVGAPGRSCQVERLGMAPSIAKQIYRTNYLGQQLVPCPTTIGRQLAMIHTIGSRCFFFTQYRRGEGVADAMVPVGAGGCFGQSWLLVRGRHPKRVWWCGSRARALSRAWKQPCV